MDSIPDGELNTAQRLHDEIDTYAAANLPSPDIQYYRVPRRTDFFRAVSNLTGPAARGYYPLIHIECHGDEDGFQLADGSLVDWDEIKQPFTELNVVTQLNLMVIVAACTGAAFAKITQISDRAPFWGMMGPTDNVTAGDLEKSFGAFYRTLIQTKSPAEAVQRLDVESQRGLFWRTTAQGLFEKAWSRYQENECSPTKLDLRAERMRNKAILNGMSPIPTKAEFIESLRQHEPGYFQRCQDIFFMRDIYPSHLSRFDVEYVSRW